VRILYVSQYYPPEMGAPAARVAELASHWVQHGHDVTVLTGFPNHPTGKVPSTYRHKLSRVVVKESSNGVEIVRTWLLPLPNRKAHERILNYSSFWLSASTTGMFLRRPDVVIGSSPQLLVGLAGWWLARWMQVPFVFEVRDLWPESLAAVGVGSDDRLMNRTLSSVSRFLYRKSRQVVVVSPAFVDVLVKRWGVAPDKISVIENGVETDAFRPTVPENGLRGQLGAEGKFLVCYVGTLGMAHGLQTLLESAARLQTLAPHVRFVLIGEGSEKQSLISLAQSQRLTNIQFVDQQAREKIPAYICSADACLVMLRKSEIFTTVIPTKMLEFMSCGRPVIVAVDGQARQIVKEAQAGLYVEPENPDHLVRAVLRLSNDSVLREQFGHSGRLYIQRHFSRRQTAKRYLEVLGDVVEGRALVPIAA
jgi:colanic acid biosynthesis glycosyl transferase WcaI